jgi:hypothetical protein
MYNDINLFGNDWDAAPLAPCAKRFDRPITQLVDADRLLCRLLEDAGPPNNCAHSELLSRTRACAVEAEQRLYMYSVQAGELGRAWYRDPAGDSDEYWVRLLTRLCERLVDACTEFGLAETHRPFLAMMKAIPDRAWSIVGGRG